MSPILILNKRPRRPYLRRSEREVVRLAGHGAEVHTAPVLESGALHGGMADVVSDLETILADVARCTVRPKAHGSLCV